MFSTRRRAVSWVAVVLLIAGVAEAAEPKWEPLLPAIDAARDGVVGSWTLSSGALTVVAAERSRLRPPVVPPAGRIITGEDDPSAREMGRKIVESLSGSR